MALSSARGKLIGVIGDEVENLRNTRNNLHLIQDTCVGFLLGGIGELDKNRYQSISHFRLSVRRESQSFPIHLSCLGGQTLWWWTRTLQFLTLR